MFRILPLCKDQEKPRSSKRTKSENRPSCLVVQSELGGHKIPPCHELNHLSEGQLMGRQQWERRGRVLPALWAQWCHSMFGIEMSPVI